MGGALIAGQVGQASASTQQIGRLDTGLGVRAGKSWANHREAIQDSLGGWLGTLVLEPTPPIHSRRQSWSSPGNASIA
jgi:hypothetical protein